mmetsp:Transcript_27345/g.97706  ORF Transcript_27345/g.97706 Transcript_27345/m.97706 type:complete len:189 (-) Transcript_27345:163-729(-)
MVRCSKELLILEGSATLPVKGPRQKSEHAVPHTGPANLNGIYGLFVKIQISNDAWIVLHSDLAVESVKSSVNKRCRLPSWSWRSTMHRLGRTAAGAGRRLVKGLSHVSGSSTASTVLKALGAHLVKEALHSTLERVVDCGSSTSQEGTSPNLCKRFFKGPENLATRLKMSRRRLRECAVWHRHLRTFS